MITKNQIRQIERELDLTPEQKRMRCQDTSLEMAKMMGDRGCVGNVVAGNFAPDDLEPHVWIEASGDDIEDVISEVVIIDPTIEQFAISDNGVQLDRDLPSVGIYTPNDEEWEWYQ